MMCVKSKMGQKQTTGLSKRPEESEEVIRLEEKIAEQEKNEKKAHIYELMQQMEYEQRTVYLPQLKEMEVENWDGTITDEDVKRMERMFPCSALGKPELLDRHAFVNLFYKLVYDVREKGRVLCLDPTVELESILESDPISGNVARVGGDGQCPLYESEEDDGDDRSGVVEAGNLAEAIDKYREMIKFAKPELEYVKNGRHSLTA